MTALAERAREAAAELLRLLASLAWVVGAAALGLAALGAVPGWLAGETHEVRPAVSVEAAERWVHAPVALPSYFPDRLAWPPAQVQVAGGVGGAVALRFEPRAAGGPPVELVQGVTPGAAIPPALLRVGSELGSRRTAVDARPAVLARVLVEGVPWEELRWERDGCQVVLRSRGELEELIRMAHSIRHRGTP